MACNKITLPLFAGKRTLKCVSIQRKTENVLVYIVYHSFLSLFPTNLLDGPQQIQINLVTSYKVTEFICINIYALLKSTE